MTMTYVTNVATFHTKFYHDICHIEFSTLWVYYNKFINSVATASSIIPSTPSSVLLTSMNHIQATTVSIISMSASPGVGGAPVSDGGINTAIFGVIGGILGAGVIAVAMTAIGSFAYKRYYS